MFNNLLKRAQRNGLILQSVEGHRFVLASIEKWEGFDVGAGDAFSCEVKRTVRNKELMRLLAERRHGNSKRIPLEEVKEQLGIE